MANQQLQMEIIAKDLATATLQKVDAALLDVANRQGSVTAATNRATTATGDFRAGLSKASNALTNLAGDALGANNKIANFAEGLLTMGVGGTVVTAVSAGILAIAATYAILTKETREAEKATNDLIAAELKRAEARAPQGLRSGQVIRAEIDRLQDEIRQTKALLDFRRAGGGATSALEERLASLSLELAQARRALREARGGAVVLDELTVTARRAAAPKPKDRDITGKLGLEPKDAPFRPELRLEGAFTEIIPQVQTAGAVFTDFVGTLEKVEHQMGFIADATVGIGEAFAGLGDVVGGKAGEAAKKLLAPFMKLEGTYFVIKGLAKLAEGLFPPNPALIASGSGMVARGRQLLAMAGGGGTGGGTGAGGGSAGSSASRDVRDTAQQRGTVTVVWPKDAFANPRDPKFQEYLAETIRAAAGRNVVFA